MHIWSRCACGLSFANIPAPSCVDLRFWSCKKGSYSAASHWNYYGVNQEQRCFSKWTFNCIHTPTARSKHLQWKMFYFVMTTNVYNANVKILIENKCIDKLLKIKILKLLKKRFFVQQTNKCRTWGVTANSRLFNRKWFSVEEGSLSWKKHWRTSL